MKSYTDLEQSKALAGILPPESADMYWSFGNIIFMDDDYCPNVVQHIPCWSLAALLKTINFPSLTQNEEDEWEVCVFDHDNDGYGYIEKTADNPVDACVAMIEKLHELKML